MLNYIRESMQGWIAWAIIILLIIPFALWGINEYFDGTGPLVVAVVDGENVSQRDFQQAYLEQRNRMQQMLGNQYDPKIFDKNIKKQALDALIDREVLFQNAKDQGFRVSRENIISTIKEIEAFQEDGQFSKELYARQFSGRGESPQIFEQRMHRAILTQQLYSGVSASAIITDAELNRMLKLQEEKRNIDYLVLKTDQNKKDSLATEDAIKEYYESNKNNYMTAEKISIEYIELDAKKLVNDESLAPSAEELQQFYEERKNMFRVPEQRRSRHILITVEEGADEKTINAAKAKADDIRKQIDAGGKFEELAEKHSQDPGSSKLGGDLGFFGKGSLDPNFEKTLFSLKKGEVSQPVLSSFGYHIIRLEETQEEASKSFDEVKEALKLEFQQDKANRLFYEISEKVTNLAYEVSQTLNDAAGAAGIDVQSTELFERRGGAGITANPKIITAAFSREILEEGFNSEAIEIGENHVVFLRLKERIERQQQGIEEVKAKITANLISDNAKKITKENGLKLLNKLKAGEKPDAIAKESSNKWVQSENLLRSDRSIDTSIIKKAFKLNKPIKEVPSYGSVVLANGDYVLINLKKVVEIDLEKLDKAKKETLKRTLISLQSEADNKNYLESVKKQKHIIVETNNL